MDSLKPILFAAGVLGAYLFVGYLIALSVRNAASSIATALQQQMKTEKLNKVIIFLWPLRLIGII